MNRVNIVGLNTPAALVVMNDFKHRQRSRSTVYVTSLYNRLRKAGYQYSKQEYAQVIKVMAKEQLAEPILDSKGMLIGLKNFKVRLQSLGEDAVTVLNKVNEGAILGATAPIKAIKGERVRIELQGDSEQLQKLLEGVFEKSELSIGISFTLLPNP